MVSFEKLVELHGRKVRFRFLDTGREDTGTIEASPDTCAFTIEWEYGKKPGVGGALTAAVMGSNSPAERLLLKLEILEVFE